MNSRASQRTLLIALSLVATIATSGCVAESSNDLVDDNEENVSLINDESIVADDIDEEGSDSLPSESVAETSTVEDDLLDAQIDDVEQLSALSPSSVLAGCTSQSKQWSKLQVAWRGNTSTAGTYACEGNVSAAPHGYIATATLTSTGRTGAAQFTCSNGTWILKAGSSCDGKIVSTAVASGISTECSSPIAVRSKWIGWYLADLKRCADVAGLNWWVNNYNNNAACTAATNYDGYGSKDTCWRAMFRASANATNSSYDDAQTSGHISESDENSFCGLQAGYPWTSVSTVGMSCKYRP